MSRRRRHKPGYITFHPDGKRALHEEQVRPVARWTLLELILLADIYKHELRGSIRWLADELGIDRNTFKEHLRELEALGWVKVIRGTNQNWGHETVIALPRWNLFTGEVGEPVGEPVGEKFTQPAPSDLQEQAPSSSSSSSTSSTGLKGLTRASPKKSERATEPWGSWTPREPWTEKHLAYVRLHLAQLDEGPLWRYRGELSRDLFRLLTDEGIPPTRPTVEAAIRDVLDADSRVREEAYSREKHRRTAEIEDFARSQASLASEEV